MSRLRHPKPCKFFSSYGNCKFGKDCSFLHLPLTNYEKEIDALKAIIKQKDEELGNVLSRLFEIEKKIERLSKNEASHWDDPSKSPVSSRKCDFITKDVEVLTVPQESKHESSFEQIKNSKENILFRCDFCDYESTSKKGISIHKGSKHKDMKNIDKHTEKEAFATKNDKKNDLIESELETYCHECDVIFRCQELLIFRNHCNIEHSWICCEKEKDGYGCDFKCDTKDELREHMMNCSYN